MGSCGDHPLSLQHSTTRVGLYRSRGGVADWHAKVEEEQEPTQLSRQCYLPSTLPPAASTYLHRHA